MSCCDGDSGSGGFNIFGTAPVNVNVAVCPGSVSFQVKSEAGARKSVSLPY